MLLIGGISKNVRKLEKNNFPNYSKICLHFVYVYLFLNIAYIFGKKNLCKAYLENVLHLKKLKFFRFLIFALRLGNLCWSLQH
jgi:hypothetical protein